MTLLDTNVLIYAFDPDSPFYSWSRETIGDAVAGRGAVINAVSLAEICVGDANPTTCGNRIRSWGVGILDIPAPAAEICALAYLNFRSQRVSEAPAPSMPLPDFFIGAHAMVMGWEIATADRGRFRTYFPSVPLKTP